MDRRGVPGDLRRAQREPDRMAGEGRGPAARGGRGARAGAKRLRAQRELASELAARRALPRAHTRLASFRIEGFIKYLLFAVLLCSAWPVLAGEKVVAARVWPAQEYTRVTFESARSIK